MVSGLFAFNAVRVQNPSRTQGEGESLADMLLFEIGIGHMAGRAHRFAHRALYVKVNRALRRSYS